MLVGNKADLRDAAAAEGQTCVPGYFGEKLAMVRVKVGLLGKTSAVHELCVDGRSLLPTFALTGSWVNLHPFLKIKIKCLFICRV